MPDCASNASPKRRRQKLAEDSHKRPLLIPISILISIAVADQISKIFAVSYLAYNQTHSIIGQFFQLKLVYNKGGALGTQIGNDIFYLISSIVILIIVLYFLYVYRSHRIIAYSLAAIAGGAIGNITDRIRLGKVVDFLDLDFFDISLFGFEIERWWTFNIADLGITIGEITLLLFIVVHTVKNRSQKRLQTDHIADGNIQNQ